MCDFDKSQSCSKIDGNYADHSDTKNFDKSTSLVRWFSDNIINQRWIDARQKLFNSNKIAMEPRDLLKHKLKSHVSMVNLTNKESTGQQNNSGKVQHQKAEIWLSKKHVHMYHSNETMKRSCASNIDENLFKIFRDDMRSTRRNYGSFGPDSCSKHHVEVNYRKAFKSCLCSVR